MKLILRESRDARLDEPDILAKIFGDDGATIVNRNLGIWNEALARLDAAAHRLLGASDPDSDVERTAFLKVLKEFAEKTEAMNRDFTCCALRALADDINLATVGSSIAPVTPAGHAKVAPSIKQVS